MSVELSPRVLAVLERASAAECLDLVVELRQAQRTLGVGRTDAIAEMKTQFEAASVSVRLAIEAVGGCIRGQAWINSTMICHVPASSVRDLTQIREIVRIDLPDVIHCE